MEEIKHVTMEEAINILKKGESKAIIATSKSLRVVDLPEYGVAGIRMIANEMDRVEYNYSKK